MKISESDSGDSLKSFVNNETSNKAVVKKARKASVAIAVTKEESSQSLEASVDFSDTRLKNQPSSSDDSFVENVESWKDDAHRNWEVSSDDEENQTKQLICQKTRKFFSPAYKRDPKSSSSAPAISDKNIEKRIWTQIDTDASSDPPRKSQKINTNSCHQSVAKPLELLPDTRDFIRCALESHHKVYVLLTIDNIPPK